MTLIERTAHITYINMPHDLRDQFQQWATTGVANPATIGQLLSRHLITTDIYGSLTLTEEGSVVRRMIEQETTT